MSNDKVDVEIYGRKMTIEMEGLSELEVNALANKVDERMRQIAKESKIVDSSKLAILTALEVAAEHEKLRARLEGLGEAEERHLDGMIVALEKALR